VSVIKEFECILHGPFEGSHPICPENGCESASVTQVFLTPVTIGSSFRKRFDAGMRKSADMYQIDDWKSAKAGDTSFAGRAPVGQELLWGDGCKKVMGRSFAELTGLAQKPLVVDKRDGSGQLRLDRNNGMREAATEAGITRRRLPKAGEVTAFKGEKGADTKAQALTV
jgi:hypothetical protein